MTNINQQQQHNMLCNARKYHSFWPCIEVEIIICSICTKQHGWSIYSFKCSTRFFFGFDQQVVKRELANWTINRAIHSKKFVVSHRNQFDFASAFHFNANGLSLLSTIMANSWNWLGKISSHFSSNFITKKLCSVTLYRNWFFPRSCESASLVYTWYHAPNTMRVIT